jgi:hypothetical protein
MISDHIYSLGHIEMIIYMRDMVPWFNIVLIRLLVITMFTCYAALYRMQV